MTQNWHSLAGSRSPHVPVAQMPRDRLTFRQRDLTAAIKAVEAAGMRVARIKLTRDRIEIDLGLPEPAAVPDGADDDDAESRAIDEAIRNAKL